MFPQHLRSLVCPIAGTIMGLHWGNLVIMENKMETTVMLGLYKGYIAFFGKPELQDIARLEPSSICISVGLDSRTLEANDFVLNLF